MNKKRMLALVCTILLLVLAMAGCGGNKAPKNAGELLEQYNAGDHKNAHMDMNIDMNMKMVAMGQNIEVPMLMKMSMDVVGDNTHGNMNISMTVMGQNTNQDAEVYATKEEDNVVTYVGTNGMWIKQNQDATALTGYQEKLMKNGMFDDAEFSYDKEKKQYTIVQNMAKLVDSEEYKEAIGSLNLFQSSGLDASMYDGLIEAMGKCTNTYVFDENLNMLSSEMSELSYQTSMEQSGIKFDVDLTMKMDIKGSKFGEIKEEDVVTPDDIKKKAVDMSGLQKPQTDVTEATTEETTTEEASTEATATEAVDDTTEASIEDEYIYGGTHQELPYDQEAPGSINGVALTEGPNDFDKTFGAMGFEPTEVISDGMILCDDPKNEYWEIYVFTEDGKGDIETVKKNGFYGYTVENYGQNVIDMKWKNGITWGAKPEDVIAVYGQPSETSEKKEDAFAMYTYQYDNHTQIEFVFQEEGLISVTFSNYKYIYDN